MFEISMIDGNENSCFNQVSPNFINNRFDLWDGISMADVKLLRYHDEKTDVFIEIYINGKIAKLGIYMMKLEDAVLDNIISFIFRKFRKISVISFDNSLTYAKGALLHNHLRIELPESADELEGRLSSKGRYNIRREKRLLNEKLGLWEVKNYAASEENVTEIWDKYFEYKKITHGVDYKLSPFEYCREYHVTDLYVLHIGQEKKIGAIVLSCEQCPIAYIENLTYDTELASFSLGQILYDEYLASLIKKGKREVYLLGGNYSYKKRYGSIEEMVYDGKIYRNKFAENAAFIENYFHRGIRKIKRMVRK